jgi:hypothetical protein
MKVADLAAELDVPASTILDQCQRFGIDATWAGAELSGSDVVVLRAELATADPIDLTPADGEAAEGDAADAADAVGAAGATVGAAAAGPGAASAGAADAPAAVPPTAVGSMPELIDEVTPDADPADATAAPAPDDPAPPGRSPGFALPGAPGVSPTAAQPVAPHRPPVKPRIERGARNAVAALVVAVVAFVASNFTEIAAVVALLWLVTALSLCIAVVDGIRGRRRVQTHPERLKGLWMATISVILAIAALIGLTASVVAAVGDDPASDAPLSIGDLQSVQVARWGYERVHRYADNGWKQPAREQGSCWEADPGHERDEQRVEYADSPNITKCNRPHNLEVAKVFPYNTDADAPYPASTDAFVKAAADHCSSISDPLIDKGVKVQLRVEYPTEVGWSDGDHDVACVLITPVRNKPLVSGD